MNKNKILWLESIRGIACLIVLSAHLVLISPKYSPYVAGCGKIGVWAFMMLSGFLTIHPYLNSPDKKFLFKDTIGFYCKKIVKIYPVYVLAVIVTYFLGIFDFSSLLKHFLFLESWSSLWFMPVIIKFYLISPIILMFFTWCKSKKEYIFWLTLTIFVICLYVIFPTSAHIYNSVNLYWYAPVFFTGMLLAKANQYFKNINYSKIYDFILIIGVFLMIIVTPISLEILWDIQPGDFLQNKYIYMSLCWALVFIGGAKGYFSNKLLSNCKPLHYISKYSFEIYLIHYSIIVFLYGKMSTVNTIIVSLLISLVAAVILERTSSYITNKLKMLLKTGEICKN